MRSPRFRVCPGRVLAEDTLFVAAATLLASFDISNALPVRGDKIIYNSGIIRLAFHRYAVKSLTILHSHPEDFTCSFNSRKSS